jgi:hypothetical protein
MRELVRIMRENDRPHFIARSFLIAGSGEPNWPTWRQSASQFGPFLSP